VQERGGYREARWLPDRPLPEKSAVPSDAHGTAIVRRRRAMVEIRGARANNLKNVDVRFPVGRLSVITGISGSGNRR